MPSFSWQVYSTSLRKSASLDLQLFVTENCLLLIYPPSRNVQTHAVMQLPVLWDQEQCVHTDFAVKTARWTDGNLSCLCGVGTIL